LTPYKNLVERSKVNRSRPAKRAKREQQHEASSAYNVDSAARADGDNKSKKSAKSGDVDDDDDEEGLVVMPPRRAAVSLAETNPEVSSRLRYRKGA
jgi:hypothetical protein